MADDLDGIDFEPEHAGEFIDLFGEAKPCAPAAPVNPRFIMPGVEHPLPDPQDSLVEEFGGMVDELRQLYTDFGLRAYRVFSVVYRWSGGSEGMGELSLVRETEFLPTPKVDVSGGYREMTPAGEKLLGTARLTEVSPRYSEAQVMTMSPTALPRGDYAFIEIRMDDRDGTQVIRRRYTIRNLPYRREAAFDWVIPLTAQQQQRDESGELAGPVLYPARLRPDAG